MAPGSDDDDPTGSEQRHLHQPELNEQKIVEKKPELDNEFIIDFEMEIVDEDSVRAEKMTRTMRGVARQVALDHNDGMEL